MTPTTIEIKTIITGYLIQSLTSLTVETIYSSNSLTLIGIVLSVIIGLIIGLLIGYFFFRNRWTAGKLLLEGEITMYRQQLEQANLEAARYSQNWSECKKHNKVLEPMVEKVEELNNQIATLEQDLARKESEKFTLKQELNIITQEIQSKNTNSHTSNGKGTSPKVTRRRAKPAKKTTPNSDLALVVGMKDTIRFDRIGTATQSEKDDLKRIKGIGPLIESRLNAIEVYTFRQIANITDDDKGLIENAINSFSGRIDRDQWITQAKTFLEQSL